MLVYQRVVGMYSFLPVFWDGGLGDNVGDDIRNADFMMVHPSCSWKT